MKQRPRKVPVIVGATASGKSEVAVEVALRLGELGWPAEVVTADSVQIYRGMDIGSAKPTLEERRGVPHHLIDIVDPTQAFAVSDWLALAQATIAEIEARRHVPVVVGGTHLYVMALVYGLFQGPGADQGIRAALAAVPQSERRTELERVDPAAAAKIHANDERRTVRALEVWRLTGKAISSFQKQWSTEGKEQHSSKAAHQHSGSSAAARGEGEDAQATGPYHLCGLVWGTEALTKRIDARVEQMIRDGLVDEVRRLWDAARLGIQAREALGYKQLIRHMIGDATLEEAVEDVKRQTRRLAKNQRTWMRRLRENPGSVWIEAEEQGAGKIAQVIVQQCFM
jgi:tRNA dimethylallyltransferase